MKLIESPKELGTSKLSVNPKYLLAKRRATGSPHAGSAGWPERKQRVHSRFQKEEESYEQDP